MPTKKTCAPTYAYHHQHGVSRNGPQGDVQEQGVGGRDTVNTTVSNGSTDVNVHLEADGQPIKPDHVGDHLHGVWVEGGRLHPHLGEDG